MFVIGSVKHCLIKSHLKHSQASAPASSAGSTQPIVPEDYLGSHRQTLRGAPVNEELRRIAEIEKGKNKSTKYRLGATIVSKPEDVGNVYSLRHRKQPSFPGNIPTSPLHLYDCPSPLVSATANPHSDQKWCTHAKGAARWIQYCELN